MEHFSPELKQGKHSQLFLKKYRWVAENSPTSPLSAGAGS
jgi:hypothetical protein